MDSKRSRNPHSARRLALAAKLATDAREPRNSASVIFSSSNPAVLSVSGRVATGLAVGSVVVSFGVNDVASINLTVSSNYASVIQLVSYAITGITAASTLVSSTEFSTTLLQIQPILSLTAEGQSAALVTYALDDDNVWTDVSLSPTLSLWSKASADLNVTKTSGNWQLVVPVGASTVTGATPIIEGMLSDSCATPLTFAGYGYAYSNLSVPVSLVVTAASTALARPNTPAATILSFASVTQLSVTVMFRSNLNVLSYLDFTSDPRTVYNSVFENCTGSVTGNGELSLSSSSDLGTAGSVTITVTMPSYSAASRLSGSLTIPVVDVDTSVPLSSTLVHSTNPSVLVTSSMPLARIACTGQFQLGSLSTVLVTLTDGSTRSGTPSLASNDTSVASVSGTTVIAHSEGVSSILATYATSSGTFLAYVTNSTVSVTSIALSYSSSTLSGQAGATIAGVVAITFSDSTTLDNAVNLFSPISSLVGFNSSDSEFITVSPSGVASLVNNSWQFETLTAFSQCDDGNVGSFSMAGNLAPANYDTKLGYSSGLTFPPVSAGGSVDASVRVQVSSSPLTTYQIWIFYNSDIFGAPSIIKGSGWSTGSFSYSTGNAVSGNIVKAILSFAAGSSATNTLVLMATVTFPVISGTPLLELITANVLTLSVVSPGTILQSATGTEIVAGHGYVSVNGGNIPQFRRLLSSASALSFDDASADRKLLQAVLPFVTGDCNGDGFFNANDATYAQTCVTNGMGSWPTNSIAQMRNCAPTHSYMFNQIQSLYTAAQIQITLSDVVYLLAASTNRLFFLNISSPFDLVTSLPAASNQSWGVTATFFYFPSSTAVDAFSAVPCATVSGYFEMNLVSLPFSTVVGSLYGSSSIGVAFRGICTSGTFSVNVITNYQSTLNMSVGFINSATSDNYAFFGMDVGAFINANTNFLNLRGSTIVSGPIFSLTSTASSSPAVPSTNYPISSTTLQPSSVHFSF